MRDATPTHEVTDGDLLRVGTSFFFVREVCEPGHPLFPGLTFWGYWWRTEHRVWGEERPLPAPYDKVWNVVNDAKRMFPCPTGGTGEEWLTT